MSAYMASQDTNKEASTSPQPLYHGVYHGGIEVAPEPPPNWKPQYAQAYPAPVGVAPERTILGMRRMTFLLSAALVIVILAAAVGGGVGGSLAVQNIKTNCAVGPSATNAGACAASTTTATTTVTATATSGAGPGSGTVNGLVVPTGTLALDCPNLDDSGQQVITLGSKSWRFTPRCGTNFPGQDIGAVIVYSFHDCLQACAAHNFFTGKDECVAVHFDSMQTRAIPSNYGNCWIKRTGTKAAFNGVNDNCGATLVTP